MSAPCTHPNARPVIGRPDQTWCPTCGTTTTTRADGTTTQEVRG